MVQNGETWLTEHPEDSKKVLDALELIVIEYLSAQARTRIQHLDPLYPIRYHYVSYDHPVPSMAPCASIALRLNRPHTPIS